MLEPTQQTHQIDNSFPAKCPKQTDLSQKGKTEI